MSNATPSRLGMVNGTGADDALFLKTFAGEVLTAFATVNVTMGRHLVRTIASGKSASFPATWKVGARYHTPGNEILGQTIKHNERVITIDDLLVSDVFLANIDEAKNHYDVRSIYTNECGYALSNNMDRNVLQVGVLAARAAATVQGGFGGSVINGGADIVTDANSALVNSLFAAAQKLDEKDMPEIGRQAALRPAQYYKLILNDKAINRDFNTAGPAADRKTGKVMELAGLEIVKTNQLPSTVVSTGPTAYQGDFTKTVGLVWLNSAMGTVKLLDLATEGEYQISRQGTLIVAKYAVGHGILRPEAAVELSSAV